MSSTETIRLPRDQNMLAKLLRRMKRALTTRRRRCRPRCRPSVEEFEPRIVPSIYTWTGGNNSSDWAAPANWTSNDNTKSYPGAGANDTAIFLPGPGASYLKGITVTTDITLESLILNNAAANVHITNKKFLATTNLDMVAGTITGDRGTVMYIDNRGAPACPQRAPLSKSMSTPVFQAHSTSWLRGQSLF